MGNKVKFGINTVHKTKISFSYNEKSERKPVFAEEYRIKKSKVKSMIILFAYFRHEFVN